MSACNMPQISHPSVILYHKMSIRGEMPVHIHNASVRKFKTKQPLHLETIHENPEAQVLQVIFEPCSTWANQVIFEP